MTTKTLDLGCGSQPKNPFNADEIYGVDIVDFGNPNIKVADLVLDPIPFEDNYFDYVTGFDFLEHVPRILYNGRQRTQPFIDILNDVWRVLKPNGETWFSTPHVPYLEAFQDPQHVNFITSQTIAYFIEPSESTPHTAVHIARDYGFYGRFVLLGQSKDTKSECHLVWHLQAVKDA
jgi:SAM-dependent methyltransferase